MKCYMLAVTLGEKQENAVQREAAAVVDRQAVEVQQPNQSGAEAAAVVSQPSQQPTQSSGESHDVGC